MKNKNRILVIVSVFSLFSLLLAACGVLDSDVESTPIPSPVSDPRVIAEAHLVPADQGFLSFSIPGRVNEILIAEGDRVSQGVVLARLGDTAALDAQVEASELAVLQAEQSLADIKEASDLTAAHAAVELVRAKQALVSAEQDWDAVDNDEFREDLDDARIDVQNAEDDLKDAEEALGDYADLDEDNPIREAAKEDLDEAQQAYDEAVWADKDLQNQYDLADAQLRAADAALDDAERQVDATQDGPNPEDLALASKRLSQAQTQLEAAANARSEAELTAPFDGIVVRIGLTEGVYTTLGQTAVVLVDDSVWYLETSDLTENEVVSIKADQKAVVTFDALPGLTFKGQVDSISDYYVEQFGDITYVVRIKLLDWDDRLRWGMTAEVSFEE